MKERFDGKVEQDEKLIEKEELKEFNEAAKGKVTPQNQHHNARKESFGQSQQQRYK